MLTVWTVTTDQDVVADDGQVSLREAVLAASTNAVVNEAVAGSADSPDEIRFREEFFGLTPRTIEISSVLNLVGTSSIGSLQIVGPGRDLLTLDAMDSTTGVFNATGVVSISGLEITGSSEIAVEVTDELSRLAIEEVRFTSNTGHSIEAGMNTSLVVRNSKFIGNQETPLRLASGFAVIIDSAFRNNSTSGDGGAIWDQTSGVGLTIIDTDFSGNHADGDGGAIYSTGTMQIVDSTLDGNTSGGKGGALFKLGEKVATITNSSITNNSAIDGGGIASSMRSDFPNSTPDLQVENSTIARNVATQGGGILNQGGVLTVLGSTISANVSRTDGGGILSVAYSTTEDDIKPARTTIANSTISGNFADGSGGGVFHFGAGTSTAAWLDLTNSTIVLNRSNADASVAETGGGLAIDDTNSLGGNPTVELVNTIVAGNVKGQVGVEVLDDAAATVSGAWSSQASAASFNGGHRIVGAGDGSAEVRWKFDGLDDGRYRVLATWPAAASQATNAPFSIIDGTRLLNTRQIDQTRASLAHAIDSGANFQELGLFTVVSGELSVTLNNNADGSVAADAIRLERIDDGSLSSDIEMLAGQIDTAESQHNLIGDPNTAGGLIDQTDGNIVGNSGQAWDINRLIFTNLADNLGGGTAVHALKVDSPAIDNGTSFTPELELNGLTRPLTADQRGYPFQRVESPTAFTSDPDFRIDIGAYEVQLRPVFTGEEIVVSTLEDESDGDYSNGDLSLREAVEIANLSSDPNSIRFQFSLFAGNTSQTSKIELESPLQIDWKTTISGPGADFLAISGKGLEVGLVGELDISGLTFSEISGNAIVNEGIARISDSTIRNNTQTTDPLNFGAILSSSGTLEIRDSLLEGNAAANVIAATESFSVAEPSLHVGPDVKITNNSARGLRLDRAVQGILHDSTISNNETQEFGGGILLGLLGPQLEVRRSIISGNKAIAGGGIFSQGSLFVYDTTISDNIANPTRIDGFTAKGGGVVSEGAVIKIDRSTFSGNKVYGSNGATSNYTFGGGLFVDATYAVEATIRSSTISNNLASSGTASAGQGGGIYAFGSNLVFESNTVAFNSAGEGGGAIFIAPFTEVSNSIFSNNTKLDLSPSREANVLFSGNTSGAILRDNLAQTFTNQSGAAFNPVVNTTGVAANLTTLADNGGYTSTHELNTISPALDAGERDGLLDQRGFPVTDQDSIDNGGIADVGAYESSQINIEDFNILVHASQFDSGEAVVIGQGYETGLPLRDDVPAGTPSTTIPSEPGFVGLELDLDPFTLGPGIARTFLGDFGGVATADVDARVGLEYGYYVDSGTLDTFLDGVFSYRVDPTDGGDFTISTGVEITDGHLYTASPRVGAYVDLVFEFNAAISGEACVFGCVGGEFEINVDESLPLVSVNRQKVDEQGNPLFNAFNKPELDGEILIGGSEIGDFLGLGSSVISGLLEGEEGTADFLLKQRKERREAEIDKAIKLASGEIGPFPDLDDAIREATEKEKQASTKSAGSKTRAGEFITVGFGEAAGDLLGVEAELGVGFSAGKVGVGKKLGTLAVTLPDVQLSDTEIDANGKLTASTDDFAVGSAEDAKRQIAALSVDVAAIGPLGTYTAQLGPIDIEATTVSYNITPRLAVSQDVSLQPFFDENHGGTFDFDGFTGGSILVTTAAGLHTVSPNGTTMPDGTFNPMPKVSFLPGESITVDLHTATGIANEGISVTPELSVGQRFTNDIGLDLDIQGMLEILALKLNAFGSSILDVGPLYEDTHELAEIDLGSIFNKTFNLNTVPKTLNPFNLGGSEDGGDGVTPGSALALSPGAETPITPTSGATTYLSTPLVDSTGIVHSEVRFDTQQGGPAVNFIRPPYAGLTLELLNNDTVVTAIDDVDIAGIDLTSVDTGWDGYSWRLSGFENLLGGQAIFGVEFDTTGDVDVTATPEGGDDLAVLGTDESRLLTAAKQRAFELSAGVGVVDNDFAFDIDDDGVISVTTDGTLVARYIDSINGGDSFSIDGAIAAEAKRKTEEEVLAYLYGLQSPTGALWYEYLDNATPGAIYEFNASFDVGGTTNWTPTGSLGFEVLTFNSGLQPTATLISDGTITLAAHTESAAGINSAYEQLAGGSDQLTRRDGTFELWFKPNDLTTTNQVLLDTGGSGRGTLLSLSNDQLEILVNGDDAVTISTTLTDTDWHHVAFTLNNISNDGTSDDFIELYLDGVLVEDTTGSPALIDDWSGNNGAGLGRFTSSHAQGGQIPGSNNGVDFAGAIHLLRFYDRALGGAEIQQNYQAVTIDSQIAAFNEAALKLDRRLDVDDSDGINDTDALLILRQMSGLGASATSGPNLTDGLTLSQLGQRFLPEDIRDFIAGRRGPQTNGSADSETLSRSPRGEAGLRFVDPSATAGASPWNPIEAAFINGQGTFQLATFNEQTTFEDVSLVNGPAGSEPVRSGAAGTPGRSITPNLSLADIVNDPLSSTIDNFELSVAEYDRALGVDSDAPIFVRLPDAAGYELTLPAGLTFDRLDIDPANGGNVFLDHEGSETDFDVYLPATQEWLQASMGTPLDLSSYAEQTIRLYPRDLADPDLHAAENSGEIDLDLIIGFTIAGPPTPSPNLAVTVLADRAPTARLDAFGEQGTSYSGRTPNYSRLNNLTTLKQQDLQDSDTVIIDFLASRSTLTLNETGDTWFAVAVNPSNITTAPDAVVLSDVGWIARTQYQTTNSHEVFIGTDADNLADSAASTLDSTTTRVTAVIKLDDANNNGFFVESGDTANITIFYDDGNDGSVDSTLTSPFTLNKNELDVWYANFQYEHDYNIEVYTGSQATDVLLKRGGAYLDAFPSAATSGDLTFDSEVIANPNELAVTTSFVESPLLGGLSQGLQVASDQPGAAVLQNLITDGDGDIATDTFQVTVALALPVGTIQSPTADVWLPTGTTSHVIDLSDVFAETGETWTAASSDPAITASVSGNQLTLTAASNVSSVITLTATGAGAVLLGSDTFVVTVGETAAGKPTVLDPLPDQWVLQVAPVAVAGLFNTGVNSSGAELSSGTEDPHYALISQPGGAANPDVAIGSIPGPWVPNNASSNWIGIESNTANGAPGEYVYRTTVDLTRFDAETASINGMWATDDLGKEIRLNGLKVEQAANPTFTSLVPFQIDEGFLPGINTLDFVVTNGADFPNPTGLLVRGVSATATPNKPTVQLDLQGRYSSRVEFTQASLTSSQVKGQLAQPIVVNGKTGVSDLLVIDGTGGPVYQPFWFRGNPFAGPVEGDVGDEIRVDGSDVVIDLVGSSRLQNVELIDLRGTGVNTLMLDPESVTNNLRGTTPRLRVLTDADDTVDRQGSWTASGQQTENSITYNVFAATSSHGNVELWLSTNAPTAPPQTSPTGPVHSGSSLDRELQPNPATLPAQEALLTPESVQVGETDTFPLEISYRATDQTPGTPPAVLVEVHYDSSFLAFQGSTDLETSSGLGFIPSLTGNLEDIEAVPDGDLRTDRVVVLSWSDELGEWENDATIETLLATLEFQALQLGNTNIRVTGLSSAGYEFDTQPVGVEIFDGHVVTNVLDESDNDFSFGDLSLREAIERSNDKPGLQTILFDSGLTGQTILLNGMHLSITDDLAIIGPGAKRLTVDAGGGDDGEIGNGDGFRIFDINDGDSNNKIGVEINGLTLTGGDTSSTGGAVRNRESLTLTSSTISMNAAAGSGGAVNNSQSGSVMIVDSTISNNITESDGGALVTGSLGTLIVTQSTISGNTAVDDGGGIANNGGTLTINWSTVAENTGSDSGDSIFKNSTSTTNINGSIVVGSIAGSGPLTGNGNLFNSAPSITGSGNQLNTDPLLGPLANNGGPTQTHALLPGSPALNAGGAETLDDFSSNNFATNYNFVSIYGSPTNNPQVSGGEANLNVDLGTGALIWNQGETLSSTGDTVSVDFGFNYPIAGSEVSSAGIALFDTVTGTNLLSEVRVETNKIDGQRNQLVIGSQIRTNLSGVPIGAMQLEVRVIETTATSVDVEYILSGQGFTTITETQTLNATELYFGLAAFEVSGTESFHDNFVFSSNLFDQRSNLFDQRGEARISNGQVDIGAYEAQTAPSADFDADGDVDGADFLAWQRGFGKANAQRADGNSDDDTDADASDLAAWAVSFGQPQTFAAATAAVRSALSRSNLIDAVMTLSLTSEPDEVDPDLGNEAVAVYSKADAFAISSWFPIDPTDDKDSYPTATSETDVGEAEWLSEEMLESVFG